MTTQSAPSLMVIGFDRPDEAAGFLAAAVRMQRHARLRMHDAVILERDAAGRPKVRQTQDVTPGRGALGGALWGLLIGYLLGGPAGSLAGGLLAALGGALLGRLLDTGIKRGKARALCGDLPPGTAALAVQLTHVATDTLARELARFPNAWLVETDLPDPAATTLRTVLRPAGERH
ncbi:DUF1269 domain-containing protein [Thermomonospora umbrina]|uniref:Putative membrane protein n=1 Tax=Thermomonospora umbrina TaxID=111806 RepID=A0A3D9SV89_9ACTN|nr:DUF1269 domain-containing protein [Thermomonospora umbrina]REE99708.1 putative membrane protein [Thermomonospora umbrina]